MNRTTVDDAVEHHGAVYLRDLLPPDDDASGVRRRRTE